MFLDQFKDFVIPVLIATAIIAGIIRVASGTIAIFIPEVQKNGNVLLHGVRILRFDLAETLSIFRINPLSNPFLFYSMVAAFLAQIAVIYIPALQWVFRTDSLSFMEWGKIGLVALSVVAAVEIDKLLRNRANT